MTTSELIKILCKQQNVSIAELARRIGQSRQNLNKKLQRDTLTLDEIKQISDAIDVKFEQSFTLPDGERYKVEN
jgi:transcriptional regulator with XRE-family HTH domain